MTGTAVAQSEYAFPTAISGGKDRVDIFGIKATSVNTVWHKWNENGNWGPSDTGFEMLAAGAKTGSNVAGVARGFDSERIPDLLDIFAVGVDDSAYEQYWTGYWKPGDQDALPLEGQLSTSMDVVSWSEDRFDVFALDTDRKLIQKTWLNESTSNTWYDWALFGKDGGRTNWAFRPTAVTSDYYKGNVFVVEERTYQVFHSTWSTGGENLILFHNIGGYCTSRPAAVSKGTGLIDLFCRGGNEELWRCSYDGKDWGEWKQIAPGKLIVNEPHAISQKSGRMDVFVQTVNGTAACVSFDDSWTDQSWQGKWNDIKGELSGPPKAISSRDGRMDVFAYDREGVIIHKYWEGSVSAEFQPANDWESVGSP